MTDDTDELHQASVHRNKLLHRAVNVITGLQTDTDSLLAAADLQQDAGGSAPQAQFRIAVSKVSPFKRAKAAASTPSYEQAAFDAAQHRNSLLQRAYCVISNLQVSSTLLCNHADLLKLGDVQGPIERVPGMLLRCDASGTTFGPDCSCVAAQWPFTAVHCVHCTV